MKRFFSFILASVMILSLLPSALTSMALESRTDAAEEIRLASDETEYLSGTYSNGISWHLNLDTYHLTVTGSGDIPDDEDDWSGKRVETAFIGEGITSLKEGMFRNYASLTYIQLPQSLKKIGNSALYGTNITGIQLPYGLTEIGSKAFYGCTKLTSITLPHTVTTIGDSAFYHTGISSMTFPDSVTSLGSSVLAHTKHLRSVKLPSGLEELPSSFFQGCEVLRTVILPDTVTSIGSSAFKDSGLARIDLPSGLTELGASCFYGTCLQSILIPGGVETLPSYCFRNCTQLKQVSFEEGLTTIQHNAFNNCIRLEALVLPSTLKTLERNAFSKCEAFSGAYFRGPGINASSNYWTNGGLFDGAVDDLTIYYLSEMSGWDDLTDEGCSSVTWYDYPLKCWDGRTFGALPYPHYQRTLSERTIRVFQQNWKYADGDVSQNITAKVTAADGTVTEYKGVWHTTCTQFQMPLKDSDTVAFICEGFQTLTMTADLLGSFNMVKLHKVRADGAPTLLNALFDRSQGEYRKLYNLYLEEGTVFVPTSKTQDLYLDVNWNGHTPGSIWLMQGNRAVTELQTGWNYQLPLGRLFRLEQNNITIRLNYGDDQRIFSEIRLTVRESAYDTIGADSGDEVETNEPLPEETAIMAGRKLSLDLSSLTRGDLPLEIRCGSDGTVRATIGVTLANYGGDHKEGDWAEAFSNIRRVLSDPSKVSENEIRKLMRNLEESTVTRAAYWTISSDLQVLGYLEGYFEGPDIIPTECAILVILKGKMQVYYPITDLGIGTFYATGGGEVTFQLPVAMLTEEKADLLKPLETTPLETELRFFGGPAIGNKLVKGEVLINGQFTANTTFPLDRDQTDLMLQISITLEGEIEGARASIELVKTPSFQLLKDGTWWFEEDTLSALSLLSQEDVLWVRASRDYLTQPSAFLINDTLETLSAESDFVTQNTFLTSVYPYAKLQQVSFENGDRLLVWVGDDPQRADADRTALFYSFYIAEEHLWSLPAFVTPETVGADTADSDPVLKCIDDQAYLVWNDACAPLSGAAGSSATLQELQKDLLLWDIGYARFNREAGAFTDHAVLSGKEHYADLFADVTVIDKQPTVVFVSSGSGDTSLTEGDRSIYTAVRSDDSWEIQALDTPISGIDTLAAAEEDNALVLYFTMQPDGKHDDLLSRELYRLQGSALTRLTNNDVPDTAPMAEGSIVTWYQNGKILKLDGTELASVRGDARQYICSASGLQAILYADSAGLYAVFCDTDGLWGQPICLAESADGTFYDYSGVFLPDNTLSVIAALSDNTGSSASLFCYDVKAQCDLKVTDVSYNPYSLAENGTLCLTLDVANEGMLASQYCKINLYDGSTLLSSCYDVTPVLSGSAAVLQAECPLQSTPPAQIRIEVLPEDHKDVNQENNLFICDLSCSTDLSLEDMHCQLVSSKDGNFTAVTVQVVNRGTTASSPSSLTLYRDTSDGQTLCAAQPIPELSPGTTYTVHLTLKEALPQGTVIYALADLLEKENLPDNNCIFTRVSGDLLNDQAPAFYVEASEDDGAVSVLLTAENLSLNVSSLFVMAAAYQDGRLLDAVISEETISEGSTPWSHALSLNAENADTVKVFLLNTDYTPILSKQIVSLP